MKTVQHVTKDNRVCVPLKKGGWGFVDIDESGLVIALGNEGAFISDAALEELGYVKACTPNDSEEKDDEQIRAREVAGVDRQGYWRTCELATTYCTATERGRVY